MNKPVLRSPPPAIESLWRQTVAGVDRDEIETTIAKSDAAAAEDSFSGFVRRCVRGHGKPVSLIATDSGVDVQRLARFLHGEGVLDTSEVDRLLAALNVEILASSEA